MVYSRLCSVDLSPLVILSLVDKTVNDFLCINFEFLSLQYNNSNHHNKVHVTRIEGGSRVELSTHDRFHYSTWLCCTEICRLNFTNNNSLRMKPYYYKAKGLYKITDDFWPVLMTHNLQKIEEFLIIRPMQLAHGTEYPTMHHFETQSMMWREDRKSVV